MYRLYVVVGTFLIIPHYAGFKSNVCSFIWKITHNVNIIS